MSGNRKDEALADQLRKLEGSLTRLRWMLLIGGTLMIGVLTGLFLRIERLSSVTSTEILYARSLRLVDVQGQNRVVLDGGGEQGIASLLVLDGKQQPRLQVVVSRPGEAQVALLDQNGTQRWGLSLMIDGTVLINTDDVMEGSVMAVPMVKEGEIVPAASAPGNEK